MIHPLRTIELNTFALHHPRVGPSLEGLLIAQISDVHMGRWVKPHHVRECVDRVNQAQPALCVLTGDYIGYDKNDIDPFVDALSQLSAPAYAVLGNHDHWGSTARCRDAFARSAVTLLTNERAQGHALEPALEIIGVDDAVTRHADVERAFAQVTPSRFALVLNHVPSLGLRCAQAGGHLILSGHTHNFQFNVPRLTNGLASTFGAQFFAGPYRLSDEAFMYINRGLGSASWPMRVRSMPELSFFELRQSASMRLELLTSERYSPPSALRRA